MALAVLAALVGCAAAKEGAVPPYGQVVDVKAVSGETSPSLGVVVMGLSSAGFIVFVAMYMRRIVRELSAAGPVLDLADPETRMEFTIERGSSPGG